MAEDAAAANPEEAPKKKFKIPTTLIIILVVTVVEGAAFYGMTSMFGAGPQAAHGEEGEDYTAGDDPTQVVETAEIELLKKFKVPNDKRGQAYMYDLDVYIKVPADAQEDLQAFVTSRAGEISDRIARIIRAADPPILHEPELKTLRLKIQHVLHEILGDPDMAMEILIPRCVPMRAG